MSGQLAFVDGRLEEPTLSFDFEFGFRHGKQRVRVGLVRSPLEKEVIVTVNRVRDLGLAASAEVRHEPAAGRLVDADARPIVTANADFWCALDDLYADRPAERRAVLHRLGKAWGWKHALRMEHYIQKQHAVALREVELHVALESLSGSLGVLGLGRFDVDFRYRNRGLLLALHHDSPFTALLGERDGLRCDVLAGLIAGFLSYVSGRSLAAREIDCSLSSEAPCRFLVGTPKRLERLFDPVRGSADENLLLALNVTLPDAVPVSPVEDDDG